MDSRLVVPSFLPSDDPIASLNKAMAFISTTITSRYPPTNNQLRTSSNPSNQATIQDGKVNGIGGTNIAGQEKVIRCYNCQEEGHMARQCTKPKKPRNLAWFKEKVMLAEPLESGVALDEEQMAFLADNGDIVTISQASQEIPTPVASQTDDLDAFDSDCDEALSASAVLMAMVKWRWWFDGSERRLCRGGGRRWWCLDDSGCDDGDECGGVVMRVDGDGVETMVVLGRDGDTRWRSWW
ncbi:retrovirus-related pol polyprotein from transposon TNT 1-94 [Tanacetum coccineum]